MDMEDWVTENAALIMEAARPFIGMGMEYDDLSQEAMLAACCAYRKYDKTRKWSMSSWVYYNVRHHLLKKLGEDALASFIFHYDANIKSLEIDKCEILNANTRIVLD